MRRLCRDKTRAMKKCSALAVGTGASQENAELTAPSPQPSPPKSLANNPATRWNVKRANDLGGEGAKKWNVGTRAEGADVIWNRRFAGPFGAIRI